MPTASGTCERESESILLISESLIDVRIVLASMPEPETDSIGWCRMTGMPCAAQDAAASLVCT